MVQISERQILFLRSDAGYQFSGVKKGSNFEYFYMSKESTVCNAWVV